jgi:hypothetical protein
MRLRALLVSAVIVPCVASCGRSAEQSSIDSTAAVASTPSTPDTTRAHAAWTVSADTFGPISLGALFVEERQKVPGTIAIDTATLDGCAKVRSPEMASGASLMVVRDSVGAPIRLDRVDVDSGDVRTADGAGIGDTESSVLALYGQRARVEPHKYTGPTGHYVIVGAGSDTTHRIVFETDGHRVLRYHAGRRPTVDQVEGCG